MNTALLQQWYTQYKESSLFGRYIQLDHIKPLLDNLSKTLSITQIGTSENNAPIDLIKLGTGTKKLVFWSQMHGNESTTTKSIFDFINLLLDQSIAEVNTILRACTLYIVPMLNPDGSKAYTRVNYNTVDLNRDAQHKTQRESVILNKLITDIQPDFAFNLHGQRTIFSVGETNQVATVSFLSPSGDEKRSITPTRKMAMDVIANMNTVLQQCIPNQVGRYDDGFNINCIGDTLENKEIPTILFEAGHYPDDYDREITRGYIFQALVQSAYYIATAQNIGKGYESYFSIPENGKYFYDIIIRDVVLNGKNVAIAIQYREELIEDQVRFIPIISKIDNLQNFYGHKEILGRKRVIKSYDNVAQIVLDAKMLKFYLDSELFSVELDKN